MVVRKVNTLLLHPVQGTRHTAGNGAYRLLPTALGVLSRDRVAPNAELFAVRSNQHLSGLNQAVMKDRVALAASMRRNLARRDLHRRIATNIRLQRLDAGKTRGRNHFAKPGDGRDCSNAGHRFQCLDHNFAGCFPVAKIPTRLFDRLLQCCQRGSNFRGQFVVPFVTTENQRPGTFGHRIECVHVRMRRLLAAVTVIDNYRPDCCISYGTSRCDRVSPPQNHIVDLGGRSAAFSNELAST